MAVYGVKNKKTGEERAIEVRTQSTALNHVAKDDYEVRTMNTREIVKFVQGGGKLETLVEEKTASADVAKEAAKPSPADVKQSPTDAVPPRTTVGTLKAAGAK